MIPNIELSPRALIEIRIKALERTYRDVYKTIDYANKLLLQYELGTAYKQLMLLANENNSKNSKCQNNHSSQLNKEENKRTNATAARTAKKNMDMPKLWGCFKPVQLVSYFK